MTKNIKISYSLRPQELKFAGKKILFVTDEKIWKNCARFFTPDFLAQNHQKLILKNPKADDKNLKKISAALKNCDFILALGSGTINDLCKYNSAQKNIPYAIIASAASMNGYLSKNASITISGHKKTLPATLPEMVFCDLEILKSAPARLTKAGIGDSLCFYSCWFDWYLSHKILGTKFDEKLFTELQPKVDFLLKNYRKFSLRDEKLLKILIEILLLSGQAMTKAGGSYPASQSEHMISHTIDMKYPKISEEKLHGELIAVTTLSAAKLQKNILTGNASEIFSDDKNAIKNVTNFFGKKVAAQCLEEYHQKIVQKPKPLDEKLKKELQKIHLEESRLKEIFSHFKISKSPKSLGLSKQEYQDCMTYAKFTRNRFTCLDLN